MNDACGSADWGRTCEGCGYIEAEDYGRRGVMLRCMAPDAGRWRGAVIGIRRVNPYVPAWCPLKLRGVKYGKEKPKPVRRGLPAGADTPRRRKAARKKSPEILKGEQIGLWEGR